jgi:hypothetical protein
MQTLIVYVTAEVFVFIWSQYHISPYGNFGKEKKKKKMFHANSYSKCRSKQNMMVIYKDTKHGDIDKNNIKQSIKQSLDLADQHHYPTRIKFSNLLAPLSRGVC